MRKVTQRALSHLPRHASPRTTRGCTCRSHGTLLLRRPRSGPHHRHEVPATTPCRRVVRGVSGTSSARVSRCRRHHLGAHVVVASSPPGLRSGRTRRSTSRSPMGRARSSPPGPPRWWSSDRSQPGRATWWPCVPRSSSHRATRCAGRRRCGDHRCHVVGRCGGTAPGGGVRGPCVGVGGHTAARGLAP